MEQKFEKNRTFTLNAHEPDQYGQTYTGTIYLNHKPHWLNAKDANGPNGPFISGYIGKEKRPPQHSEGQSRQPEPQAQKPAPRRFEVDPQTSSFSDLEDEPF